MATPDDDTISLEDFNRSLFGSRAPQAAPAQTISVQTQSTPVAETKKAVVPSKPSSSITGASAPPVNNGVADTPNMNQIVDTVIGGTQRMSNELPAPKPQDSIQDMVDLVKKHWEVPAAIVGTATAAAILNHIMKKGGGSNLPPLPGGGSPIEPMMDVNQQNKEPYLEAEKPTQTIKSRSFSPAEQYIAENINKQYPFTFEEAKKGLGLEGVKVTDPTQAKIVADQYSKQLQAQAATNQPPAVTETISPVSEQQKEVQAAATEVAKQNKPKKSVGVQPPNTGGADNWLHSMAGKDVYMDVIKTQNEGKPYGPSPEAQTKAYSDWRKYQNEVGRMRPYTNKPVLNLEALEAQKFKSANIPGKIPFSPVPPPSLQAAPQMGGGGGGSLIRGLTDPLQLKQ